jgi:uncharacterized protein (DUF697 family)
MLSLSDVGNSKNITTYLSIDSLQGDTMVSTPLSLADLAKQGQPEAIATLLNRKLQPKGISAKVTTHDRGFRIRLEGQSAPDKTRLTQFLRQGFRSLNLDNADELDIYGWRIGDDFPAWHSSISLRPASLSVVDSSTVTADSQASSSSQNPPVNENVSQQPASNDSVDNESSNRATQAKESQNSMWNSMFGAVTDAMNAVGSAATQTSEAVANSVAETTSSITETTTNFGNAAASTGSSIADSCGQAAMSVPGGLGYVFDLINDSPQLQDITKALKVDWLVGIIDKVDIVKAETHVKKLQKKYPNETSAEISRRIMTEKVLYVGSSGMASSLLPGFAAPMIAVDLAATTAIQAEMGYQIACAYGFDVRDQARKGEIVAIFGLALGGSQALKVGFKYLARNIPIAGAVVGASTNAVALYAVGHAACHYYEAKRNNRNPLMQSEKAENEKYLQEATRQQVIMDQILVHLVIAGSPDQSHEDILATLTTMNLSAASLAIIQKTIQNPNPLDKLLAQVNPEFAVSLLAQCRAIAEADDVVTEEESRIIEQIAAKLSSQSDSEAVQDAAQTVQKKRFRFWNRKNKAQ